MLDAVDIERVQRIGLRVDGFLARGAIGDELGDHRIVEHRDLAALFAAGIVAHHDAAIARAFRRRPVAHQAADGGQEIAERVLGIDAAFDGPAVNLEIVLLERQLFARRDPDHQLDEVEAR